MPILTWDETSQRKAEHGIEKGVFYPEISAGGFFGGVVWNGLRSVSVSRAGQQVASYYYDGIKYFDKGDTSTFEATIAAYSVPGEFHEVVGNHQVVPGVILTRQPRKRFGLSYKTLYADGENYKIHIIYNVSVVPSESSYESELENATVFSWKAKAIPVTTGKFHPSPHFIVDSSKIRPDKLHILEKILYGTEKTVPRLPTIKELVDLIVSFSPLHILPDTNSGLAILEQNLGDLYRTSDPGMNRSLIGTRLYNSSFVGLYRLE